MDAARTITIEDVTVIAYRWADGYLPMNCPQCGRRRLMYALAQSANISGEYVMTIDCEKCDHVWGFDTAAAERLEQEREHDAHWAGVFDRRPSDRSGI
jgi:hypothetical protein